MLKLTPVIAETTETITYTRNKKGTGRKALPKSLPFIQNIHDLNDDEKQCACGCSLTHIGDDISEQLDVVPQMTFRVVNIRKKYACKGCSDTMRVAKLPKQPLDKAMAAPGLLAAIIDAKFNRHMPLYRQEAMFGEANISITRGTLSNWMIKSANLLTPLKDKESSPEIIFIRREQDARPVLAQIKVLLDDAQFKVPPKSPLGTAVFYALNHWDALNIYLQDGRLEIDNNKSERSIKPFVIGRKNWLFHGNDVGAQAGSILFSLIETCKQHKVDVFSWMKYVLANIHRAETVENLEKLLPYNMDPLLLSDMRSIPELIMPEKDGVN